MRSTCDVADDGGAREMRMLTVAQDKALGLSLRNGFRTITQFKPSLSVDSRLRQCIGTVT